MAGLFETLSRLLGFGNAEKENRTRQNRTERRREIDHLVKNVASGEYIRDLRIGRSWILPKMVGMSFNKRGKFSESRYYENLQEMMSYEDGWSFLLHNYRVLSNIQQKDPKEYQKRARWWTKEVAVAMAKNDLLVLKAYVDNDEIFDNCKGGPYVYLYGLRKRVDRFDRMFFLQTPPADYVNKFRDKTETIYDLYSEFEERIQAIESADSLEQMVVALNDFDKHRCHIYMASGKLLPDEFVSAYAGDGAYYAMMTMVKFLHLNLPGALATRDDSIAQIERMAEQTAPNGKLLFSYCGRMFFDKHSGGTFDYKAYMERGES